jgi:hypothetical protein
MRNLLVLALVATLGACSTAQLQTALTRAATAQVVIDKAACDLQTAANQANSVATAAGSAKVAAVSVATSVASGALCMTLPVAQAVAAPAS